MPRKELRLQWCTWLLRVCIRSSVLSSSLRIPFLPSNAVGEEWLWIKESLMRTFVWIWFLVDNYVRRRSPQTRPEAPPLWLKGDSDRRYQANLVASGCRMFILSRSTLVTLSSSACLVVDIVCRSLHIPPLVSSEFGRIRSRPSSSTLPPCVARQKLELHTASLLGSLIRKPSTLTKNDHIYFTLEWTVSYQKYNVDSLLQ